VIAHRRGRRSKPERSRFCWVLSLPFALRYLLATRPEIITQVLGIVYRAISGHLIRKAGLTRARAATSAVTLIQRFGSALNLNVHFHLLVLDGVYRRSGEGRLVFVPVPAPSAGRILKHLGREDVPTDPAHQSRAPPRTDRLI